MPALLILMVILQTMVMSITLLSPRLLFADTMHQEFITDNLADINTRRITIIHKTVMEITATEIITETTMEKGMEITEIEIIRTITKHSKKDRLTPVFFCSIS